MSRWEQIESTYQSALERDEGQRAAFLDEVCAGDEELRREVESLLACDASAQDFMGKSALQAAAKRLAADRAPALIGRQFGAYQIISLLGAGGMGTVYRATDTRLNRSVAIKVLHSHLSAHRVWRQRFEREARAISNLNHPHICALYDIGRQDDCDFLVMEYLEGQTLAQRLKKGPLPTEQVLRYAIETASALDQAHQNGVTHRDLKPGNIMLTKNGTKLLDFGLAKRQVLSPLRSLTRGSVEERDAGGQSPPTETDSITEEGMILGTLQYMAPEQVEGKEADARTDIFALGVVIYEMATGRKAFEGESKASLAAAILTSQPPPITTIQPTTPPVLERVVQRCLAKDPEERWQSTRDLAIELKWITEGQSAMVVPPAAKIQRGSRARLVALSALSLLLLFLAGWLVRKLTQPAPSFPVVRSVIKLDSGHWLAGMRFKLERPTQSALAMSKEGRFIVYSAITEIPGPQANPQLYLLRTDQAEAKSIAGTEGGISPFLSPDDRWVGFWTFANKLMKVAIDGGVPVTLCNAEGLFGASWASDNSIIFAPNFKSGLFRISAEGGQPESLTTPDKTKEDYSHRLPHCLPDGKGVLFTIMREANDLQPRIAWLDLKIRKWRVLMEDAADARYVPTGHLVFLRQGTLMVVPFDLERLQVTGQPVPAIVNVMQALNASNTNFNTAAGQFSISDSGWLVYAEGGIFPDGQNSLDWVDQKGRAEPVASFKAPYFAPRLSPDGQRIAYTTLARERGVWVYDLNRGTASRLTGEGKSFFVNWTPDGKRVVFGWSMTSPFNLYWQPADGSSAMERLTTSDYWQSPGSWSPDGATLAFVEEHPDTKWDILLLDLRSRRITPFLNSRAAEWWPEFSPDGRWLAYVSDESGREEVYVRPFPGPGGKWQISQEGGSEPLWARNGRQLFYRQWGANHVWVVDVRTDGGFFASKPRLLFEVPGFCNGAPIRSWDLSLDGQRFLMVKLEDAKPTPVTELVLVQNWFEELKHLAPTGRR